MSYKFVSIEYATTEEAAEVAARLNATGRGDSVRVRTEGRIVEVVPANALLGDLFNLFSHVSAGIAGFFGHSPDTRNTAPTG